MPRHRTGEIRESVYLLRQQEERHRGEPAEERVRALRMLKEDPSLTMMQIADQLNCSERTVRRWWTMYQKGGLEAVIQEKVKSTAVVAKLGDEKMAELGQKLARRELSSLAEVQGWLKSECNLEYSIPGVWHLVRRTFKVERSWAPRTDVQGWQGGSAEGLVPTKIVRFLNSLPLLGGYRERNTLFRNALMELLPDVDHIVVNVDKAFNFETPDEYHTDIRMIQGSTATSWGKSNSSLMVTSRDVSDEDAFVLLESMRSQGVPLDRYYPPEYMNFRLNEQAYIGTVFFFREVTKQPTSAETFNFLASIETFFYFMLFDLAAHHQVTQPADQVFTTVLRQLAVEANLTIQERKVIIHQLLGGSYKDIADALGISIGTLKKHMTSIHQKTGTRSQGELFARYFTPRLMPILNAINNSV